jgi:hypothetical protein
MANARAANAHEYTNLFMRDSPLPALRQSGNETSDRRVLKLLEGHQKALPQSFPGFRVRFTTLTGITGRAPYYHLSSGNSKCQTGT